jgi:hypothetical protein
MSDKTDFESIDAAALTTVSGGLSNKEMSSMVMSRVNSNFGRYGSVQQVGKMHFGADKNGFVLARGKFDVDALAGATERRSLNAVIDVNHHSVQHLQTEHFSWPN